MKPGKVIFSSRNVLILLCLSLFSTSAISHSHTNKNESPIASPIKTEANSHLSAKEIDELKDKLVLLDNKAFMPTILPVIMQNQEALQLTDDQVKHFIAWRKKNLKSIIESMTLVIEKNIAFKKLALNPDASGDELLEIQGEIFKLQRHVLELKLECRDYLTRTFSEDQWDNFSFILSEHPKLASFLN